MSPGNEFASQTAEAVARRSYGKLIAYLSARTRDVTAAEDALADAFASALSVWPEKGCPQNPEGWLLTVARRKMIDARRRERASGAASGNVRLLSEELELALTQSTLPDRRLALMFVCAHPAIDQSVRSALILQVVLGLDASTVASAFLTSPAAMAKRLSRAKEKIRDANISFELPERDELPGRLSAVLDAIYAAFTKGWADGLGTNPARQELLEESLYLARLVVELLPDEPEALGLFALMLYAAARQRARRSREGDFVPLDEQDTSLWEKAYIDEAETALLRARDLRVIGRYQLEAALQSAHVHRCIMGTHNWPAVVNLYDALFEISGSPVVAVNRAIAVAECYGAARGVQLLEEVAADPRIGSYQPYWAARAELLARSGRRAEARSAFDMAIGLELDPAIRRFLQERRSALA